MHDGDKTASEDGAGGKRIDGVLADADGEEGEQEGQAGDNLRIIAQGVHHHDDGDGEEQDKVDPLRVQDTRVGHEMHRVGDEKGERPAAADESAREDAVAIAALKVNACAKDEKTDEITED